MNQIITDQSINKLAQGKNVLFITSKNLDYIRNTQEINALKQAAKSLTVLGYPDKSYAVRLLKLYWKLLTASLKQYDLVFVGFAPQLVLPFLAGRLKGKFVVEDFFISLYDTMIWDRKKFKPGSIFAKFLWKLDKFTITKANAVIADTRTHGQYFAGEFGVDTAKLHVIYLQADTSIYYPRPQVKPEEWADKFIVLYFGSVLPLQGVDIILDCIEQMKNVPAIVFDIIGPIDPKALQHFTDFHNVRFTPWLSQQELAARIAAADLCLAGHFNKTIAKACRTIAGKTFIYRAMDKPMILGDNPANRELFAADIRSIFYVEMGDPVKLKAKILESTKKIQQEVNCY